MAHAHAHTSIRETTEKEENEKNRTDRRARHDIYLGRATVNGIFIFTISRGTKRETK